MFKMFDKLEIIFIKFHTILSEKYSVKSMAKFIRSDNDDQKYK